MEALQLHLVLSILSKSGAEMFTFYMFTKTPWQSVETLNPSISMQPGWESGTPDQSLGSLVSQHLPSTVGLWSLSTLPPRLARPGLNPWGSLPSLPPMPIKGAGTLSTCKQDYQRQQFQLVRGATKIQTGESICGGSPLSVDDFLGQGSPDALHPLLEPYLTCPSVSTARSPQGRQPRLWL